MSTDARDNPWRYAVIGEWLVQEANQCTCQGPTEVSLMHQPGCGYEPLIKLDDLKAALDAGGYSVVKLPPPAGMDTNGQIWFDVTEHRVDTTGSEPQIWWGRIERTVEQLRTQAAELLSVVALVDAINAGPAEVEPCFGCGEVNGRGCSTGECSR